MPGGRRCWPSMPTPARWWTRLQVWRQVAAIPAVLPAVQPGGGYLRHAPGSLSVQLDVETTRMLLGEVPAAFHAGIHDILVIAFGLAVAEFLGTGGGAGRY